MVASGVHSIASKFSVLGEVVPVAVAHMEWHGIEIGVDGFGSLLGSGAK